MADILRYDHRRDFKAVRRIHYEVGWIDGKAEARALEKLLPHLDGVVYPIDGEAECAVFTAPGAMRHGENDVDMTAVLAVTTSRVARKLGAAKALTAHALAQAADAGSEVATLGMFDQGFYDRLGFGTGAYSRVLRFDPATLRVDRPTRSPKRLTKAHWRDVHRAMCQRQRSHGGCVLHPEAIVRQELAGWENAFGLGYYDGPNGELSHFVFGTARDEHGPYDIGWYAYRSSEQLFELLALIKSLADQVISFAMHEPPEIQLQDLLRLPFRHRQITQDAKHQAQHRTHAYWQARMLDLPACLAKTRLDAEAVAFNLRLADPIAEALDAATCDVASAWRGVAGNYTVRLGEECWAKPDHSKGLPLVTASVGAFTRLWLGVRSASSLALTDDLRASDETLRCLDRTLRLPPPHPGWDF